MQVSVRKACFKRLQKIKYILQHIFEKLGENGAIDLRMTTLCSKYRGTTDNKIGIQHPGFKRVIIVFGCNAFQ